jgi:pilus assembly protein Flp/PilA
MSRSRMQHRLRDFLRDESGTTAIEYSIIATGIALVIIATVVSLGTSVQAMFQKVSTALTAQ